MDHVDALRGLAILGILTVHVSQRVTDIPVWLQRFALSGQFGVQLFFIASAYTLTLNMSRRIDTGETRPWARFFWRRGVRLVPLAFSALVLNVLVNRPPINAQGLGLTLLSLNGWSPAWINTLIQGGWFLADLAMFYLALPAVLRLARDAKSALVLVACGVGGAFVCQAAVRALTHDAVGSDYLYLFPPAQFGVFAMGILLARLRMTSKLTSVGTATVVAAAGLAMVALSQLPPLMGIHFVFAALQASIVFVLAAWPLPWLVNRATTLLGRVSFSFYLWHFFVVQGVLALLGRTSVSGAAGFASLWALVLIGSTLVASASYVVLERGLTRLGDRLGARLFPVEREIGSEGA